MTELRQRLAAILTGVGVLYLGQALLTTLIGVRMSLEDFSTFSIGIVTSAFYVGGVLGSQLCSRIVKRVAHIRAFTIFAALLASSALTHTLVLAPEAWAVLRAVSGFSIYGLYLVAESWLNAAVTPVIRGRVLGTYMFITFVALTLGQLLLNAGDPAKYHLFGISGIVFALALIPVALTRTTAPIEMTTEHLTLRRLFRISPFGLVGSLASGMVIEAFLSLGSVYAAKSGLSTAQISLFMSAPIVGGLLLQWPFGWLSDRFDRRWTLLAIAGGTALSALAVIGLRHAAFPMLLAIVTVHGGLFFSMYPLSLAHANDKAEPDQFVELSRGLLLVYFIGALIAPFGGSLMMDPFGPSGLFVEITLIAGALTLFGLYSQWRKAPVPDSEQRAFYPYGPRTTTEVYGIDPRQDTPRSDDDSTPLSDRTDPTDEER